MGNFKMNPGWEAELMKAVQSAMQDTADDTQLMFDSLSSRYKGRPIPEIKSVLRREWARRDGTFSEPELTEYAMLISEGTRIVVEVE